jgi:hypothetical protein
LVIEMRLASLERQYRAAGRWRRAYVIAGVDNNLMV